MTLLEEALRYAEAGYYVLPIIDKNPLNAGGFNKATVDPNVIKHWWGQWPFAQIGIATGKKSKLAVLDIDSQKDGVNEIWAAFIAENKLDLNTAQAQSGGGGTHYYFRYPENATVRSISDYQGRKGIDFRGAGGFIVAPPSTHANGKPYVWIKSIFDTELLPAPEFMHASTKKYSPFAIEPIREGQRNISLTVVAGLLRSYGLEYDAIYSVLWEQNLNRCQPPLSEQEVAVIAGHIVNYPPVNTSENAPTALGDQMMFTFEQSELGFADLFAAGYAQSVKCHKESGEWYWWDGNYWSRDRKNRTPHEVANLARRYLTAANSITDDDHRYQAKRFGLRMQQYNSLNNVTKLLQSNPAIIAPNEEWDVNPDIVACPNGIVNLKTGQMRPGQPSDMVSVALNVPYTPTATAPNWAKFLESVFAGNKEVIAFVQAAVGYSLTGHVKEQSAFLMLGYGSNGKTTFLEILHALLGEYAYAAPFNTFERQVGASRQSNDLAILRGKRLVTAAEPHQGAVFDESRLKSITGGDKITARFLYKENFTFSPECKIWIAANHLPRARDESDGFWRRIKKIDFNVKFWSMDDPARPEGAPVKNPDMLDILKSELEGILVWAVEGARRWYSEGLTVPEVVQQATAQYRKDSNPLTPFIENECEKAVDATIGCEDLYKVYTIYCASNGYRPYEILRSRQFRESLKVNFPIIHDGVDKFLGIRYKGTASTANGHVPQTVTGITLKVVTRTDKTS